VKGLKNFQQLQLQLKTCFFSNFWTTAHWLFRSNWLKMQILQWLFGCNKATCSSF